MNRFSVAIFGLIGCFLVALSIAGCKKGKADKTNQQPGMSMQDKVDQYTTVKLTTDMSKLSGNQKKIIGLLIDAGQAMDDVFWKEAYGNKKALLDGASGATAEYIKLNYGPWDRLEGNQSFIDSIGTKPEGANFYPADMTKKEFENWDSKKKDGLYTLVRRDENGDLMTVPYHEAFAKQHKLAADKLKQAAKLAKNEGLKKYLNLRSKALLTDDYQPSDFAWLDMKDNALDVVVGPIETYEDKLYGYKAAHETFVLVKDKDWSDRLSKYTKGLAKLQRNLPVPDKYKQEKPGQDSDLNVYDAVYYAGSANAGGKTIAINLPNDEEVQLKKGTRRLYLKNTIRAKYEKILEPIADKMMVDEQQENLSFNAFFNNTMFHEVAHGLGIKHTLDGKGTVRDALKDHASALEEGKADVVGLYMIEQLRDDGKLKEGDIKDNYVTFVASIFRSIRFGSADAHGLANLIRFNYFKEKGAVTYDKDEKAYRVNFDKMPQAVNDLSRKILEFQGDGNYQGVDAFVKKYGQIGPQLQKALDSLGSEDIPKDIIFKQGKNVLGIE